MFTDNKTKHFLLNCRRVEVKMVKITNSNKVMHPKNLTLHIIGLNKCSYLLF